ncbi:MAG TPA: cytochrome P450, partial [Nannocystis exedens]|nr:cytochrome P450 [Nannocystis exedens]
MNTSLPELDRFDVVSPGARANIHARYKEMRAVGPVHRFTDPFSGKASWLVLSYEGCVEVLRDTSTFIRDKRALPDAKPPGPQPRGLELITHDMVHRDPPEHTRLRRLINRAFSSRIVAALRDRARTLLAEIIETLDNRDNFDLIADFATPLPIRLICEMLGVPRSVEPQLAGWSADAVADNLPRMLTAVNGFRDLIDPYIDAFEKKPTDTLLSRLIHARTDNGERLSRIELHSMMLLLFLSGHETTINLLSNCFLALDEHPELRSQVLADPQVYAPMIEEVLRFDGAVDFASVRFARVQTTIHEHPIAVGDQVFVSLLAANRDPQIFANPDTFDIQRDNRMHIAFGAGVHSCLGTRLARMEVFEAMSA